MSSTESISKYCLLLLNKFWQFVKPSWLENTWRSLNLEVKKFIWTMTWEFSLQWTLGMREELNCPTTWKPCSGQLPWWCLITRWLLKSCFFLKDFHLPKNWAKKWPNFTNYHHNNFPNKTIMTLVWELSRVSWSWPVVLKDNSPIFLKKLSWFEPCRILIFQNSYHTTFLFSIASLRICFQASWFLNETNRIWSINWRQNAQIKTLFQLRNSSKNVSSLIKHWKWDSESCWLVRQWDRRPK